MALRDLLIRFGIQVDGEKKLQSTDVSIRKTILSAERLGNTFSRLSGYLLVGAVANGVKNFIESQIEQANALKYSAERLGISADELQKYTYVADIMGIKTEQVAVAMRYFNRTVGEAALGTKSATKEFALLGINIKGQDGKIKPTSELLGEFSDKLAKMPDQATRTAHAMRVLGRGGSSMLPELQKGSAVLKQMFKDVDELGGGFNETFIKQAADVNVEMKRLKMGWRSISVVIATEVLPYFKRWIERSIETAKRLIDLAKHTYGFRTALVALTTGVAFFALKRFLGLFKLGEMGIKDFFFAFTRNAGLAMFVGLLVGAYLALDDLYTFMQGGDSLLGRFLDKMGGDGTALQFWHDMKDAIKAVGDAFGGMDFTLKSLVRGFAEAMPAAIEILGTTLVRLTTIVDHAVTGLRILGAALDPTSDFGDAGKKIEALTEGLQKRIDAYNKIGAAFEDIGDPAAIKRRRDANWAPGGKYFEGPLQESEEGLNNRARNGGVTQPLNPINITNHITIDGAKDPNTTGQAVTNIMRQKIDAAVEEDKKRRDTWDAVWGGMPTN